MPMITLKQEFEQALEARRAGARDAGKNRGTVSNAETVRLLERKGYRLSRNHRRSTCPQCWNGRRDDFVVSIDLNKGVYFCHRCNRGGKIENLFPAFTFFGSSPARIRKADVKKREFQQWLAAKMSEMANRERRLAQKAALASQAIQLGVEWAVNHLAWLALADFYDARRQFETFWQDSTDRIGRLELYKQWRRGTR